VPPGATCRGVKGAAEQPFAVGSCREGTWNATLDSGCFAPMPCDWVGRVMYVAMIGWNAEITFKLFVRLTNGRGGGNVSGSS
jgi:hypothetical protein